MIKIPSVFVPLIFMGLCMAIKSKQAHHSCLSDGVDGARSQEEWSHSGWHREGKSLSCMSQPWPFRDLFWFYLSLLTSVDRGDPLDVVFRHTPVFSHHLHDLSHSSGCQWH